MRLTTIVLVLAASTPALAENKAFFEADAGVVFPVADDQYSNAVDESFKLGVRLGAATSFGGIDVGFDFTPYNDNVTPAFTDVDVQRFRIHVGVRYNHQIGPKTTLFARFGGGIDLIHYEARSEVLGIELEASETDAGIALEASAGILFDLGKVKIGAKLGLPMAFHFEPDDPNDNLDADLEYTSVDVDVAFVVSIPF